MKFLKPYVKPLLSGLFCTSIVTLCTLGVAPLVGTLFKAIETQDFALLNWGALGIVGFVFTLPQMVYQMILLFSHIKDGGGETPLAFLIVATICTFCSTILYSALYVINAFHYYSLAEAKDGVGLMERIEEIGNTTQNNVEEQY